VTATKSPSGRRPKEDLEEFNSNIVGTIGVIADYDGSAGGEPIDVLPASAD
jgi:hypothetical protein